MHVDPAESWNRNILRAVHQPRRRNKCPFASFIPCCSSGSLLLLHTSLGMPTHIGSCPRKTPCGARFVLEGVSLAIWDYKMTCFAAPDCFQLRGIANIYDKRWVSSSKAVWLNKQVNLAPDLQIWETAVNAWMCVCVSVPFIGEIYMQMQTVYSSKFIFEGMKAQYHFPNQFCQCLYIPEFATITWSSWFKYHVPTSHTEHGSGSHVNACPLCYF